MAVGGYVRIVTDRLSWYEELILWVQKDGNPLAVLELLAAAWDKFAGEFNPDETAGMQMMRRADLVGSYIVAAAPVVVHFHSRYVSSPKASISSKDRLHGLVKDITNLPEGCSSAPLVWQADHLYILYVGAADRKVYWEVECFTPTEEYKKAPSWKPEVLTLDYPRDDFRKTLERVRRNKNVNDLGGEAAGPV